MFSSKAKVLYRHQGGIWVVEGSHLIACGAAAASHVLELHMQRRAACLRLRIRVIDLPPRGS